MRVDGKPDQVILTLSGVEVERLSAVLGEATLALSRAEFYIRTGCSAPNVLELVRQLALVVGGTSHGFELPLLQGVEKRKKPREGRVRNALLGKHGQRMPHRDRPQQVNHGVTTTLRRLRSVHHTQRDGMPVRQRARRGRCAHVIPATRE